MHALLQAVLNDLLLENALHRTRTHEVTAEIEAAVREHTASVNQEAVALHFLERCHAYDFDRSAVAERTRWRKDIAVHAAMDHMNLVPHCLAALSNHDFTVEVADRHGKGSSLNLGVQHAPLHVQVRAVRSEAEGNAGEPIDDERRGRRVTAEMRVDVRDAAPLHLVGETHGLR